MVRADSSHTQCVTDTVHTWSVILIHPSVKHLRHHRWPVLVSESLDFHDGDAILTQCRTLASLIIAHSPDDVS